jgi:DNA-binding response OmpR family regulator
MMKKNILVVEDDKDIREIICFILEDEEYEVNSCPDATSFRSQIFNQKPDLVIMDVMLPDGNGIDLCCEVKSDYHTNQVPVLMMSAHSSLREIRERCKADDFIKKPFDIYNLIDKVAHLIKTSSENRHTAT